MGHKMLSLKLSKYVSKRSKAENKGKKEKKRERIAQLNGKYVYLQRTGDKRYRKRENRVRKAGGSDNLN